MLTPKRLLLMFLSFVACFAGYQVYLVFLGHYDGLPPLPPEHVRGGDPEGQAAPPPADHPNPAIAKLIEAFGPNCDEQHRRIILEWRLQGTVMAADRWELLPNGRLGLSKVSVALYGKPRNDGKAVEINTIRGDSAEIEFDKPITDFKDVSNRKPMGGRLQGQVHVQNNRRTPRPNDNDDLHLYTDWLAYREDQHRLWTEAAVRVMDSDPPQATITATGMEVALIPGEEAAAKEAKKDHKKDKDKKDARPSISGVKYVRLERDVRMNLKVDARSGFLGNNLPKESEPAPVTSQPEKTPIIVSSRGPFTYTPDDEFDQAEFTDQVYVIRQHKPGAAEEKDRPPAGTPCDQLDCDRLVMLFRRQGNDAQKQAANHRDMDMELVSAHATGKEVVLLSEAAHVHALGNDLLYDAASKCTTLKGDPFMKAEQDGNEIQAPSLVLKGTGQKDFQEAVVQGPGQITMRSKNQEQPPILARWLDELRTTKEGDLDRLELSGKVSFEDPDKGRLHADRLIVWLETLEKKEPTGIKKQRVPRKVEATGNITTNSTKLLIHQADRLWMQFEDAKPAEVAATPEEAKDKDEAAKLAKGPKEPKSPAPAAATGSRQELKDERPIELWARSIDVWLVRDGSKTDLQKLRTDGDVHVTQQAAAPEQGNAVEIKGESLELLHYAEGNVLNVQGQPGYVQLDKLYLVGPVIYIDQPENQASVTGTGSMKMPSKTDFEGKKLAQPSDLVVHWKERMVFDGKIAEFDGGVNAVQGNARLVAHMLQVVLDRPVSLKERQPGQAEQAAGLYRLLCDSDRQGAGIQEVRLTKGLRDGDKWRDYTCLTGRELSFDNPNSDLIVYGPGTVHLLHAGSKQGHPLETAPPPAGAPKKPQDEEMKLTRVTYLGSMHANSTTEGNRTTRIVIFTRQIELVNFPADDPDAPINVDKPAPGMLWMSCGRLKVLSQTIDKQTTQEFTASSRVIVRAQDFYAQADLVKYDESKDLLILEGEGINKATLWRQRQRGGEWEQVRGKKIWYWRKENRFKIDETETIHANP